MKPKIQVETFLDCAIQQLEPAAESLLIGQMVGSLQIVIALSASNYDVLIK